MDTIARTYEQVHPGTRGEWREWLAANHATSPGVWLVSYKAATGKPRVTYDEAVEEALCFGWIDSRPHTPDDERSMLLFTPRRPRSPWSRLNKERIERLIAAGLMAPAGLAKIETAREDGSWASYDAVEDLTAPEDLLAALAANEAARQHYASFSPSAKKQLLWWIASAKRSETRTKRIAELVAAAAAGRNPLDWRAKQRAKK
jgi:uncharacterized protein YdeI (YjbR/CyaY-like superfamily)